MPAELMAIAYYGLVVAVVYPLVNTTRLVYWSHSRDNIAQRRSFVYGLTYARNLTGLACIGGIAGVLVCSTLKLPMIYSLGICPVLPLLMHFSTTREARWTKFFYR